MSKAFDEIYCHSCGKPIKKEAEICIACGVKNKQVKKSYNRLVAGLLCLFLGYLGAHRFYVGKMGDRYCVFMYNAYFPCILPIYPRFWINNYFARISNTRNYCFD